MSSSRDMSPSLRSRPFLRRPVPQRFPARGLRRGRRATRDAFPARAVLDPPFSKTGACPNPGTGAAGGTGAPSRPGGGLRLQSPADACIHRMDRRASFPVFAASCPSAGLACVSHSGRAAHHAGRRVLHSLRFPTHHLHGGRSPLLIIVRGMAVFRMDAPTEKLALFRFALIAPLVIERLPRGELTRRAQEIAARNYAIPHSKRPPVSSDTFPNWPLPSPTARFPSLGPTPRTDRRQSRA